MNPLLDDDDDDLERTERELTLSTGMILGIFLVLVLLCGAFFGFGYKMGSHKATLPVAATDTPARAAERGHVQRLQAGGWFSCGRSFCGSRTGGDRRRFGRGSGGSGGGRESSSGSAGARCGTRGDDACSRPVATGSFVVQVAAVSHEEDAQLLVNALRAKGYPVSAHVEQGDKFFHIQVGPFNNMKDATAAKQRLVADGYQPIIK